MKISREQFELAVNNALRLAVDAYRQHNDQWAVFRRDMAIQSLMSFYDVICKRGHNVHC